MLIFELTGRLRDISYLNPLIVVAFILVFDDLRPEVPRSGSLEGQHNEAPPAIFSYLKVINLKDYEKENQPHATWLYVRFVMLRSILLYGEYG